MAEYGQMNPGIHHVGHRFVSVDATQRQPEEVVKMVQLRFKTAVVVNRTVYVGNVKKTDINGQFVVEGDSMYKSAVGKFDQFSDYRRIDVSIRDGDEIVKLEEYADRILQFKKDKLHLVNVSQEIEFLEDTFMHKGVSHPASVSKTDYGIVWANKHGVYLYDGQRVSNLLEKQGRQLIKEEDWKDFSVADKTYSTGSETELTPMVGYIPHKRQIVIFDDITNNSTAEPRMYLYDMVTQSWVQGSDDGTNRQIDAIKTNFAHDKFGSLIYVHTTQTMAQWYDKQDAGQELEVITKDIDFGEPGRRKKVYKVLVTYKGTSATNVAVDYAVDGGTTFPYDFADGTNFTSTKLDGSSSWAVAELKPDTSSESNNIKSFRLRFQVAGTGAEVTTVECIADSSDSLDGKYFDIYGAGGKTEVWIDTDNSGTSAPSGSGSYAQTIEVTEIETDDTANAVAIAVAAAVDDHANFSCEVRGNIIYITDAASATRTDASDGNTGFTIAVAQQGGTATAPSDFSINDISIIYRLKPLK